MAPTYNFRDGRLKELWSTRVQVNGSVKPQGSRAADVGCGHGASSIAMAEAYPASTFMNHPIRGVERRLVALGNADRVLAGGLRRRETL
jgi:tRNA G46 methylase TrmB